MVPPYLIASKEVVKERAPANYVRKKVPEVAPSFHNYMAKVTRPCDGEGLLFAIPNIVGILLFNLIYYCSCVGGNSRLSDLCVPRLTYNTTR